MDEPFSQAELVAIFNEEELPVTATVKACLERAAYYRRLWKNCKDGFAKVNLDDDFVKQELYDLQNNRCKWILLALDAAHEEKTQHWRYIEDGDRYLRCLLIKYNGDLSQCDPLEKAKIGMLESFDEMNRRQQKGEWR